MLCAAISSSLCDALNKLFSPGQTIATVQRNISQHCWPNIFKPRPNDRNISTQHIPILLGATSCVSLATMLRGVATCYELKIELGPGATLLHEPGQTTTTSCNIHKCCLTNFASFKFEPTTPNMSQHIATRRNMVAKRVQHVAPNNVATCCVEMLRSFGRGFTLTIQVATCFLVF